MTTGLLKSCNTRNKMYKQATKGLIQFSVYRHCRYKLMKQLKAAETKYFNKFFNKY